MDEYQKMMLAGSWIALLCYGFFCSIILAIIGMITNVGVHFWPLTLITTIAIVVLRLAEIGIHAIASDVDTPDATGYFRQFLISAIKAIAYSGAYLFVLHYVFVINLTIANVLLVTIIYAVCSIIATYIRIGKRSS